MTTIRAVAFVTLAGETTPFTVLGAPGETFDQLAAGIRRQLANVERVTDKRVTDNGPPRVTENLRGCETCGGSFVAKRRDARFCGATCRQRSSRARRAA